MFDASGAALSKADLDLALNIDHGAFVKLAWDAPNLNYRANVEGVADFAVAPITVAVKADGNVFVGASVPTIDANAALAAKANVDAKANLKGKLDAKARADVKAPTVNANAKVTPPKIDVNKSASASAGAGVGGGAGASAGAGAGFSIGK